MAVNDEKPVGCFGLVASGLVFVLAIACGVGGCVADHANPRDEILHVESKDMAARDGSPVYKVFAREGVYESRDSLLLGKFDSADVYGRLQPGKAYRVHACGTRWPFLSMFPNVVRVHEEVGASPPQK